MAILPFLVRPSVGQYLDLESIVKYVRALLVSHDTQRVILQNGAATGDVFQVASALKLHRDHGIVIFASHGNPRDRGAWIHRYYTREWSISGARAILLWVRDPEETIAEINSKKLLAPFGLTSCTVGWATNLLRDSLGRNPMGEANAKLLRKYIKGTHLDHGLTCEKLAGYCIDKGIPTGGNVVVLWSRRSGKTGGLHPDLDSGNQFMAQIAEALQHTHTVLVVGDIPKAKIDEDLRFRRAIFLGEFWRYDLISQYAERSSQILVFEYLRRNCASLVHLGMRSGTLDGYAIAGHCVVYILDQATEASDDLRMGKLLEDKVLLDYRRVSLSKAPKLLGQLSRSDAPGLIAGFDLKAGLIAVQRTGQVNADPVVQDCFNLLREFDRITVKTEQYRFFKRNVVTGMSPLFDRQRAAGAAKAVEALQELYSGLVEFVLRAVRERRELDQGDLEKILAAIKAPKRV